MNKKILRYALITSVVLGSTFLATTAHASYESYDSGSKAVSQMSYKYAKKHLKHVYKLAFFENEASDDDDTTYYKLGWYTSKNKLKQHTLSSDDDSWQEIVDPNLKTPYVVISNDGSGWGGDYNVAIHRPPYNMYNQPVVSGKVTAKEGN